MSTAAPHADVPETRAAKASSALAVAKRNVLYTIDPRSSPAPTRLRTRAILKTLRYIGVFIFWRVIRSLKYAAVGALTAAVAGSALGPITGGIGFILAPPGILAGGAVGLLWGLGKFGWRTAFRRVKHGEVDHDAKRDEHGEARGEGRGISAERAAPRMEPW